MRLHAKRLPKHQQIENDKTPSPEKKTPDVLRGGCAPESDDTVPVDESQDKNKKYKEKQQASEKGPSPEVSEPHKEERDETTNPMVLLLKFPYLERLLLHNLGVEPLFLHEDTVTVEADEFTVGRPQIEPVRWASAHRTSRQEPFGPTVA